MSIERKILEESIKGYEAALNKAKEELEVLDKLTFGDIVSCVYGTSIMLYTSCGILYAHNSDGKMFGTGDPDFYTKTGRNIFRDAEIRKAIFGD